MLIHLYMEFHLASVCSNGFVKVGRNGDTCYKGFGVSQSEETQPLRAVDSNKLNAFDINSHLIWWVIGKSVV